MGRKRITYDATVTHSRTLAQLHTAINYLGGCLVEDANPDRPSEVVIQWSPRTAKRMRPQLARTAYSGWQAIPLDVVEQIIDAYHAALPAVPEPRELPRCRPCAQRGASSPAIFTVAGSGTAVLCALCMPTYRAKLANVVLHKAVPVLGRPQCARCDETIMVGPHVKIQMDLLAKVRWCKPCWNSRAVSAEVNTLLHAHRYQPTS